MNRKLLLIPLAAGISLAGLALAQSAPEGIDLEAIRARSAEHAKDADALASTVRSRAEAVHEEALQSQSAAQAAATRFAETVPASAKGPEVFDFDAMVRERAEAEKAPLRSEEHTSELQSLMRISYAVFCLKKKKQTHKRTHIHSTSNLHTRTT